MKDKKEWGGRREGVRSCCLSPSPLSITVLSRSLFVFVSIHLNSVEWFIGKQSVFKSQQLANYTFSLYWCDGFRNMLLRCTQVINICNKNKFYCMNNSKARKRICVHVCLVVSKYMLPHKCNTRILKESLTSPVCSSTSFRKSMSSLIEGVFLKKLKVVPLFHPYTEYLL